MDDRTDCRKPIALLACGSFNPPTNMHLRMFERAKDYFQRICDVDVVEGVITINNDDDGYHSDSQSKELVSVTHRTEMVKLAIQSSNWIRIDSCDSLRKSNSTILTALRHTRQCMRKRGIQYYQHYHHNHHRHHHHSRHHRLQHSSSKSSSSWSKTRSYSANVPSSNSGDSLGPTPPANGNGRQPSRHQRHHSSALTINGPLVVSPTRASGHPESSSSNDDVDASNDHFPRLMLLCGADLLQSFTLDHLWESKEVEEIVGDYGLVVIGGLGTDPKLFVYDSDILSRYENNIYIVTEWVTNDISSTKVRRALQRGESVRYLVPDPVASYISQHELYRQLDSSTHTSLPTPSAPRRHVSGERSRKRTPGSSSSRQRSPAQQPKALRQVSNSSRQHHKHCQQQPEAPANKKDIKSSSRRSDDGDKCPQRFMIGEECRFAG